MADAGERHWIESFAEREAARGGEPAWLEAARKAAIARFAELGVPTRRHEEWKYTQAARIAKGPWRAASAGAVAPAALETLGLGIETSPRLVFVNGRFAPALSSRAGLAPEVTAGSFRALLASHPERLEPYLALPSALDDRAFAALAAALAEDGAFLRVPRAMALPEPVLAVFLSAPEPEPAAAHPRLVFVAEAGSRATLVELHVGLGDGAHWSNALGQVVVGENASVEHVRLQLEGAAATHLAHFHARVERDGRFASRAVSLGARIARHDVVATLAGPGAECSLDALYGAVDQHVDNRSTVDHQAPHTASRELYKGVLLGRSRGIFSGRVIVRRAAQKTDARQKNANLLLSGEAEVDSKPQLEIEADDVKCSHGSTIGQLGADALFYLRARGLDEGKARAMLTRAFAAEITDALPSEPVRERVEAELAGRLFGADRRGRAA